jgi:hypothetical protein
LRSATRDYLTKPIRNIGVAECQPANSVRMLAQDMREGTISSGEIVPLRV